MSHQRLEVWKRETATKSENYKTMACQESRKEQKNPKGHEKRNLTNVNLDEKRDENKKGFGVQRFS